MHPLSRLRFDALAGYARRSIARELYEEIAWFASDSERVLATVIRNRFDGEYGAVLMGRDERDRYRAIDIFEECNDEHSATRELTERFEECERAPDAKFWQHDCDNTPVDFFAERVPEQRLHPLFLVLRDQVKYSPARAIIQAMMLYHEDADGSFVEQFQTTAFDARIWELYLYATFVELGFDHDHSYQSPDFVLASSLGNLAVEATTVNPPQANDPPAPADVDEFRRYLENYIPMKLARSLRRKLNKKPPYWEMEHVHDLPFVIAIQDFHAPGSMRYLTTPLTEYVFGVRHHQALRESGLCEITVERIEKHRWGNQGTASGFFELEGAENISAVVANPIGTLPKFNRMGYVAGFGNRQVQMRRIGLQRCEHNADGPEPKVFDQEVHSPDYRESWVEGMVVLHNPRAKVPLDPEMLPGACHEFLQPDGRINSLIPEFHPFISQTATWLDDQKGRAKAE